MSALSRMTDSRFIMTASRPTSTASSASFLAIFCTPSRKSLEVREAEGLRCRASRTAEKSLSSESAMVRALSFTQRIMRRFRSRSMTICRRRSNFSRNLDDKLLKIRGSGRRQSLEQRAPVDPTDERVDQILRMRHQAEYVESVVEHAGNAVLRAIRI